MSSSNRNELFDYLNNWKDPIKPSQLADMLGLSLATIRVYKKQNGFRSLHRILDILMGSRWSQGSVPLT